MRDIKQYATEYLKEDFEQIQVAYRRRKIQEIMTHYPHCRILEIGCGMQPLFSFFDDFELYYLYEPSELFYKNAVDLADNDSRVVCVEECFQYNVELEKKHFDFILCSGLLHEVEHPEKLLEDICKISQEDTVVHINVPNAYSLHRILAVQSGLISNAHQMTDRNRTLQQNRVYDMELLNRHVCEAGFTVLDKGSYFVKPFTHKQMSAMLEHNIIDEAVLDGFYNIISYMPEYGSEIYVNVKRGGE